MASSNRRSWVGFRQGFIIQLMIKRIVLCYDGAVEERSTNCTPQSLNKIITQLSQKIPKVSLHHIVFTHGNMSFNFQNIYKACTWLSQSPQHQFFCYVYDPVTFQSFCKNFGKLCNFQQKYFQYSISSFSPRINLKQPVPTFQSAVSTQPPSTLLTQSSIISRATGQQLTSSLHSIGQELPVFNTRLGQIKGRVSKPKYTEPVIVNISMLPVIEEKRIEVSSGEIKRSNVHGIGMTKKPSHGVYQNRNDIGEQKYIRLHNRESLLEKYNPEIRRN